MSNIKDIIGKSYIVTDIKCCATITDVNQNDQFLFKGYFTHHEVGPMYMEWDKNGKSDVHSQYDIIEPPKI